MREPGMSFRQVVREDRSVQVALVVAAIGTVILVVGTLLGFFKWTWGPPPADPTQPTLVDTREA